MMMKLPKASIGLLCLAAAVQAEAFVVNSPTSSSTPTAKAPFTTALTDTAAIPLEPTGGGQQEVEGASIPNEVFNLVKSIVGAGVLSLPYGVACFGDSSAALLPATLMIGAVGLISAYTFGLIGRVCQRTNTASYSDAWDRVFGKSTSWLIALSCVVDCFAGNLSYSMILADTVQSLFSMGSRTTALLSVTGIVLLPLCWMKNLASLAPFSLVGILGMLYTCTVMGVRWASGAYAPGGALFASQPLGPPVFGTAGGLASAVRNPRSLILMCMLSNAYIAHFNAPKFYSELRNPTMPRFHRVIAWSFAVSIGLYATMTGFGFLTFGKTVNGLVLNNYSAADGLLKIARIAVSISVACSYPLCFVGTRDGVLDLFRIKNRSNQVLNGVTLGLLAIVTLLASKLTDLGLVASLGGATFGTALVFLYPCLMFVKSQAKAEKDGVKTSKVETWTSVGIAAFGLAMGAIGTVLSLRGE